MYCAYNAVNITTYFLPLTALTSTVGAGWTKRENQDDLKKAPTSLHSNVTSHFYSDSLNHFRGQIRPLL